MREWASDTAIEGWVTEYKLRDKLRYSRDAVETVQAPEVCGASFSSGYFLFNASCLCIGGSPLVLFVRGCSLCAKWCADSA